MGMADDVFDKFTCINVIVGFAAGIILAYNHNNPDMWFFALKVIIILGVIFTIIPTIAGIYSRVKKDEEFSIFKPFRIFLFTLLEIGFGAVLGIIIGSILINNYHIDRIQFK